MKINEMNYKSYIINAAGIVLPYVIIIILTNAKLINNYYQGILMLVCINIILAVSLNITTGFLGQLALGHAGFMSVGAYAAALFTKSSDLPNYPKLFIGLLLGGIMAAILGLLVGVPALRLKGDYLAIITLGFGEIIRVTIENLKFTGGAMGLRGIPRLSDFTVAYWVMTISVVLLYAFIRSRQGRAIISISQDDIASESSGVNNTYYKTLAFTIAAFFAGVAGGVYAHYMTILGAKTFDFLRSIEIMVIVVLGGMGSITGSIIAAIILTFLPEVLRGFAMYRMLIYSLALILIMIFKPSGLFGGYEFSLKRLLSKILYFFRSGKIRWKTSEFSVIPFKSKKGGKK